MKRSLLPISAGLLTKNKLIKVLSQYRLFVPYLHFYLHIFSYHLSTQRENIPTPRSMDVAQLAGGSCLAR